MKQLTTYTSFFAYNILLSLLAGSAFPVANSILAEKGYTDMKIIDKDSEEASSKVKAPPLGPPKPKTGPPGVPPPKGKPPPAPLPGGSRGPPTKPPPGSGPPPSKPPPSGSPPSKAPPGGPPHSKPPLGGSPAAGLTPDGDEDADFGPKNETDAGVGKEEDKGPPPPTPEEKKEAIINDPKYAKYKMMQIVMLPEGAIRNKMEADKILSDVIDTFCPKTKYVKPEKKEEVNEEEEDMEIDDSERPPGPCEDWEETKDDVNGGTYFINRKTWESSWVAPKGWKEVSAQRDELLLLIFRRYLSPLRDSLTLLSFSNFLSFHSPQYRKKKAEELMSKRKAMASEGGR